MKTSNITSVLATARGAEAVLPLITERVTLEQWAKDLAGQSVVLQNGREISSARAALNGMQFAMTNIALALRAATEFGLVKFTQASAELNRIYTLFTSLRMAFAGIREEAHRELSVAELTLLVKDGAFECFQSGHEPYTEEELMDMGLGWDSIEEILLAQEAGMHLHQPDLQDTGGGWVEDEGEFRTSIHEPKQLWDLNLKEVKYGEFAAAPVALIGLDWPTQHPMWEQLLDRLAEVWEASLKYAAPEDREALERRIANRARALEDLHARPVVARWVINHATRRVWRDMEMLKLRKEEVSDRLGWLEREAMNEERSNRPARLTRKLLDEKPEYERVAYLYYLELKEAETARDQEHDTQIERERSWAWAQIEAIDELLTGLDSLYRELRSMDLKLARLWELFADSTRPSEPPLYWSKDRYFLAHEEEEARAQVRIEAAIAKQRIRAAEGDALERAAALVARMLGL